MPTNQGTPTLDQKVEMYEDLLHSIQMNAEIAMNNDRIRELIGNICRWSYAHRQGNGEPTEEEQQAMIDAAFWKLLEKK